MKPQTTIQILPILKKALDNPTTVNQNRFYEACYERLFSKVYSITYYYSPSKAEDLTQGFFLKICQTDLNRLPTDSEAHLVNYLVKIAVNHCRTQGRLLKNKVTYELIEAIGDDEIIWQHEERVEWSIDMKKLVKRLNKQEQLAIVFWMEGYAYDEIAEMMGKTKGAIRNSLCRAKQKMREILNDDQTIVDQGSFRKCG